MTLPGICGPVHPPPTFDAVGAGYQGGFASTINATETHVLGAAANACLVAIGFGLSGTVTTISCSCGSKPMTQLCRGVTATNFLYVYVLLNPPTGSQTIAGNLTSSGNMFLSMNSVSYSGVRGFGAPNINTNAGSTTVSNTINWGPGYPVVFQCMENSLADLSSMSAYTGTTRSNQGSSFDSGQPLLIGDTIGLTGSGTSLSATCDASAAWEAIAVPLY